MTPFQRLNDWNRLRMELFEKIEELSEEELRNKLTQTIHHGKVKILG